MNPLKPLGTGAPVAGRVLNKIMRPGAQSRPRGFAAMTPRKALEIQRQGGNAVASKRGHMRKLAAASVRARSSKY